MNQEWAAHTTHNSKLTLTMQYGSDRPLESAARSRRAAMTCTIKLRGPLPPAAAVGEAAAAPPGLPAATPLCMELPAAAAAPLGLEGTVTNGAGVPLGVAGTEGVADECDGLLSPSPTPMRPTLRCRMPLVSRRLNRDFFLGCGLPASLPHAGAAPLSPLERPMAAEGGLVKGQRCTCRPWAVARSCTSVATSKVCASTVRSATSGHGPRAGRRRHQRRHRGRKLSAGRCAACCSTTGVSVTSNGGRTESQRTSKAFAREGFWTRSPSAPSPAPRFSGVHQHALVHRSSLLLAARVCGRWHSAKRPRVCLRVVQTEP